jgi:hypothetical protein
MEKKYTFECKILENELGHFIAFPTIEERERFKHVTKIEASYIELIGKDKFTDEVTVVIKKGEG